MIAKSSHSEGRGQQQLCPILKIKRMAAFASTGNEGVADSPRNEMRERRDELDLASTAEEADDDWLGRHVQQQMYS